MSMPKAVGKDKIKVRGHKTGERRDLGGIHKEEKNKNLLGEEKRDWGGERGKRALDQKGWWGIYDGSWCRAGGGKLTWDGLKEHKLRRKKIKR